MRAAHRAVVGGIVAAGIAAGCGGDAAPARPPVAITQSNAEIVAGAVVSASTTFDIVSALPFVDRGLGLAAVQRIRGVPRLPSDAGRARLDQGNTRSCAQGGTHTKTVSGKMVTEAFQGCGDGMGLVLDGTIATELKSGDLNTMAIQAVNVDITITEGAATVEEHGAYDLLITNELSLGTLELRGDHFAAKISRGGAVIEDEQLPSFDLTYRYMTTSSMALFSANVRYKLSSTLLDGEISVETPATLPCTVSNGALGVHGLPYEGQLLVSGGQGSRLQITIHGDDSYTPPAGEGQVELALDTGSGAFGAPIWVDWADLPLEPRQ